MTLGLVMLSFVKLVVHQHCMELLCDCIIRHGLLVTQGKGCRVDLMSEISDLAL